MNKLWPRLRPFSFSPDRFMLEMKYRHNKDIPYYLLAEKTLDRVFVSCRRGILNVAYSTWNY